MEKLSKSTFTIFALLVLTVLSVNVYALSGSGTENDPYLIQSLSDFNDFVANAGYWNDYTRLDVDIDLTGIAYTMAPISPDTSTSSGFQGNTFTGNFDGNGHKISNLTVNTTTGSDYLGLFGYLATGAEIKNLGIEDCNIAGDTGSARCGGLVGFNYHGTVNKCYATGTVTGDSYLGGLAGYSTSGDINNCYAEVSVTGDDDIGGLIGYSFSGDISYCYSTGAVSGNSDVGGLIGSGSSDTITACFWDIETSGQTTSGGGTGKNTAEMQDESTFTDAGWDFVNETANGTDDIWMIDEGNDYPRYWLGTLWGSGTENDPWLIRSLTDFNNFVADSNFWNDYIRLDVDIDLSGTTYATAVIAPDTSTDSDFQGTLFSGNFDGNGHKIFNLTIDTVGMGYDFLGLFGRTETGTVIKNLGIEDCNITGGDDSDYLSGLIGFNYSSTISNCYSTGSITGGDESRYLGGLVGQDSYGSISSCYATCTVTGKRNIGGLVGINLGCISNCYADGNVAGINYSYYTGGLTGSNAISTSTVSNCYSVALVSGGGDLANHTGGLVGYDNGSITNSFWDIETSEQTTSGQTIYVGGTGKTTAEMKTVSTFLDVGWDLIAVWNIEEEQIYPLLRKYLAVDINYDDKVDMIDFATFADCWLEGIE